MKNLTNILLNCSGEVYKNFKNDLAKLIYEKSNHSIPMDICKIQADNSLQKQKYLPCEDDATLEELADAVIFAFEQ